MVAFVRWELRTPEPLLSLRIFARPRLCRGQRRPGHDVDRVRPVLLLRQRLSQVSLGKSSSQAGLYLLYFFLGFVVLLNSGGGSSTAAAPGPRSCFGGAIGAVGFFLLAGKLTDLSLEHAVDLRRDRGRRHRADARPQRAPTRSTVPPSTSYSEVTGITQTARNFGASLGLAVLGTVLVHRDGHQRHRRTHQSRACRAAWPIGSPRHSASGGRARGSGAGQPHALVHDVQLAFAQSTQTVFYIMAAVMAATFVVAVRRVPRGRVETADAEVPPELLSSLEPSTPDL